MTRLIVDAMNVIGAPLVGARPHADQHNSAARPADARLHVGQQQKHGGQQQKYGGKPKRHAERRLIERLQRLASDSGDDSIVELVEA